MQVNAYLMFDGRCEAAFKFYERALGAKIEVIMTYRGMPDDAGEMPPEWSDKVMHGRITIDGQTVMASDTPPGRYLAPQGYAMSLGIADPGEAERVFQALSEGATVRMPMAETFWARRFGMLVDQFGIPWMVNCEKPRG
jgi:PhnB protein